MSISRPTLHLNNSVPLEKPKTAVQVLVCVKRNKPDIKAQELYTPKQVSAILRLSISRLRDLRCRKKGLDMSRLAKGQRLQFVMSDKIYWIICHW